MTENIYLNPGTRVELGAENSEAPECGIVIHCWWNEKFEVFDCYVAFFGKEFPDNEPQVKPYVLRYASTSFRTVNNTLSDD